MDVDRFSFPSVMFDILIAISKAHFVSIHFEFSGISSKQPFKPATIDGADAGRMTLQERYEETKEAAERYQILQIGLTCVEENFDDPEHPKYVTRPYNLFLNPVIQERLDIERVFSYQSGAVDFLMKNGFRMEAPFVKGVPYLSRDEEALATKLGIARGDRSTFVDIAIQPTDTESIQFIQRVREEIETWKAAKTPKAEYLNIALTGQGVLPGSDRGLNNFHKRLVHQLVRSDYPDLVTVSKPTFIQIIAYNQEREDAIRKGRLKHLEEQLSRQVGFRWLVEAMVQGDLSGIDPINLMRSKDDEPVVVNMKELQQQMEGISVALRDKPTVLVGHNVFTDMVNLYRCFLGPLPPSVKEFKRRLNRLFPMIIDTKYLATHNCGSINPKSSLGEIDAGLRSEKLPVLKTHPDHRKYDYFEAAHEAGYDSLLTANVLVRLSTKLEASGTYIEEHEQAEERIIQAPHSPSTSPYDDSEYLSVTETLEQSQTRKATGGRKKRRRRKRNKKGAAVQADAATGASSSSEVAPPLKTVAERLAPQASVPTHRRQSVTQQRPYSHFAHPSLYDVLTEDSGDDFDGPIYEPGLLMPPFASDFWRVYGNKLRVFGTVEGVCDLDPRS